MYCESNLSGVQLTFYQDEVQEDRVHQTRRNKIKLMLKIVTLNVTCTKSS